MWSEDTVSNQMSTGQNALNNDTGESLASARRDLLMQLLQLQQQEEELRQEQSMANLNNQNGQSRRNTLQTCQMNFQPQENHRAMMPMSNPTNYDDQNRNVTNQSYMQGLTDTAAVHASSAEDEMLARKLLSRFSHRQELTDSSSNSIMHIQGGQSNDIGFNSTAPIQQMELAGQNISHPGQMFNIAPTMAIADPSRNIPQQQAISFFPDSTMTGHNVDFGQIPEDALFISQLPEMKNNAEKLIIGDTVTVDKTTQKKRKRSTKKKPLDMPRRPLSAYNLFFSEERERILKEISGENNDDDKDSTDGLSHQQSVENTEAKESTQHAGEANTQNLLSKTKCKALMRPLDRAGKKRRPHRKTHGKIGFKNLAQMVGQRWRSLPKDKLEYYQKLAKQDMKRHKQAMEEYYKKKEVGEKMAESPLTAQNQAF